MKDKFNIIVVISAVFSVSGLLADGNKLPTQEQASKLAAAVWKEPIRSIDITYYTTIKAPNEPINQIRRSLEEDFNKIYKSKSGFSSEVTEKRKRILEMNMARILKEKQIGQRKKVRLRIDGNRQRTDMVFEKPEVVIFEGTEKEEHFPGKQINDDTPFEITTVDKIDKEGLYTHFEYFNEEKGAVISTKHVKSSTPIKKSDILELTELPQGISFVLKRILGEKENLPSGKVYLPDQSRLNEICSGAVGGMSIRISPINNTSETNDRIKIIVSYRKSPALESILVCDKDDYSKVYSYEIMNTSSNQPIMKRLCSNFDLNGFPHNAKIIKYDNKGNLNSEVTYSILSARLNVTIPDEVFEFNLPKDYTVNDMRLTLSQREIQEIERMKEWLGHEKWTDRLRALARLENLLRDNPEELKDIPVSLLNDEYPAIRAQALIMLERLMKDNPDELRNIAESMKDDNDATVREIVKKILQ
jgi:hypothetical protein